MNTLNLTPRPAPVDRRVPSGRRLAAVHLLMSAAPELDVARAVNIVDAAAIALEANAASPALAVLELAAPAVADRLLDRLRLGI